MSCWNSLAETSALEGPRCKLMGSGKGHNYCRECGGGGMKKVCS